ncbi:MAG: RHS repeat-associated core domain-containing protein [Bacteroidia bacterium]
MLDATALARFISTDPLAEKYPGLSPYNYVANNPVILIDPDGREIYIVIDGQAQKVTQAELDNPDNNSFAYQSLRASLQVEDNYVGKYLQNAEHDIYIGFGADPTNTLPNAQKFNQGQGNSFAYDDSKTEQFYGVDDISDFGATFDGLDISQSKEAGKSYSLITLKEGFYGESATSETKKSYFSSRFGELETGAVLMGAYELNHEFGAHIDNRNDPRF